MSLISPAQASDNVTSVNAASINTPINTIANDYNGNITDANVATAAAIGAQKLAGGVAGMFGAWTSYTPTWTNFTVSGSTVTAKYIQLGKTVIFRIGIVVEGGNTPSGSISVSLPVTSVSYTGTATVQPIAKLKIFDTSSSNRFNGFAYWASTSTIRVKWFQVSGTAISDTDADATNPMTWANGDELFIQGEYEAA